MAQVLWSVPPALSTARRTTHAFGVSCSRRHADADACPGLYLPAHGAEARMSACFDAAHGRQLRTLGYGTALSLYSVPQSKAHRQAPYVSYLRILANTCPGTTRLQALPAHMFHIQPVRCLLAVLCSPSRGMCPAPSSPPAVMLDTDAQDCPPEGVCRPSMPSTCGLWSDNATALGMQQCDRLYSPSLEYVLALHPDATLVLYKLDPVTGQLGEEVWATGERYGYSARLTLYTDPVLVIDAIKEDGEMDVFFPDGTEYYDAMDPDKAPYTLVVGDDGIVRILNRLGQVAWASKDVLTPPVLAPPPSYGPYGPYGPYGHGSSPPPYGYPPAYAPPSSAPSYSPPPPPPPPPAGNPPYGERLHWALHSVQV